MDISGCSIRQAFHRWSTGRSNGFSKWINSHTRLARTDRRAACLKGSMHPIRISHCVHSLQHKTLLAQPTRVISPSRVTSPSASAPFPSSPSHFSHQHSTQARSPHVAAHASAASASGMSGDGGGSSVSMGQKIAAFTQAFWKFVRPHTIRGTILGTTAVTTRALLENPDMIDWGLFPRAILGLVALLCGNGFIVGINQIYDVDIDQVNKPYLPIASGELKTGMAWALVLGLAAAGIAIVSTNFGSLITGLYCFGLFLGTIYSTPPLRLKQYAVPAFLIIATVRGFLLNFGVYYATRAALLLPFQWSPAISFITVFVTIFAIVIAITKDLPDIEGDKANGIETFATSMGVRNVSLMASGLLLTNYIGAAVLSVRCPDLFNSPVMAGGHALLGAILIYRAFKLESDKYTPSAVSSYYRWIWNLFYSEYLLLPWI